MNSGDFVPLSIPEIGDDWDVLKAAIEYANRGWYVLAVEPDTKRPAGFYGKGWQHMSSRDPQEIASWFAGSPYALGLHVGRSGAICFDVDEPEFLPDILRDAFTAKAPPFQSTRENTPGRGHYLFWANGRRLGNSRGTLGKEWGEVRGRNGIIVVEPSHHSKFADGGQYRWITTGTLPRLPESISICLPDAGEDIEAATDAEVAEFMRMYVDESRGALMKGVLKQLSEDFRLANEEQKGSRHEALVKNLCWAMREARFGWYPAKLVADTAEMMFIEAMNGERHPKPEFDGVLAFAVAQAKAIDVDERTEEAAARLKARDAARAADINVSRTGRAPKPRPRLVEDYFTKDNGIDVTLLADDVLGMGPLALGPNNDFWKYEGGTWVADRKELSRRVVHLLDARFRNSHASNVETVVRANAPEITCDPVSNYMNFVNGMLDWRSGELLEHAPHYGSTVQFPLAWNPSAECPQFDAFLKEILTPDYIELAWQMIGYLMYSGNPKQKAFLFLGAGANGKGTLLRVIEALLGKHNCSAESLDDLNGNRFAAFSLFAKIANIAGDIDATYQTSTAAFKKLTGEDTYYGEQKYGDRFGFQSWAVPVFSANKVPGSSDTSFGYLRRWIVLKFDRIFADNERKDGLSDLLIEELEGIAVKAVAALRSVIDGNFKMDGDIAAGQEEFAETIDQVRQWLTECTVFDPEAKIKRTEAYASYRLWAQVNGHRPVAASEFYTRIVAAVHPSRKVDRKIQGTRYLCTFTVNDLAASETTANEDDQPAFGGM